nr:PREDICTED: topless-related protein 1-like isoform X2 [Daucus carota subsp. sativus]
MSADLTNTPQYATENSRRLESSLPAKTPDHLRLHFGSIDTIHDQAMDSSWKDFQTLQFIKERQFKGSAHKSECESSCYFDLDYFSGLILDGNWEKVEMYLLRFLENGDSELSRPILNLIRMLKHCQDLKETSKEELDEIQAARLKLVNYMKDALPRILISQSSSWQHSGCPDPAPQPPEHRCIGGQVSQITPNMQDSGSESAPPQRRTTRTAQISLGAVTRTIPSNDPVAINYSNTGQSATEVQRARRGFPTSVAQTLDQSSSITTMDFNPVHSTILLVGTLVGDIALWEVDSGKVALRPPQPWDTESLSPELLLAFEEASISVCRVRWNQDGTLFGVAYSKHIIQLYSCPGTGKIVRHKEINAHIGSVYDLVFAGKLLFTCGSDILIKVWDLAANCQLVWVIQGCPAYSLCPVVRGDTRFLISHSFDGQLKVWSQHRASPACLFRSWKCTTKSYIPDSKRLFTSGTDEHGKAYIVEWQVRNGERKVKRSFRGLNEYSGHLHFDLNKNSILAAGYNHQIKFWDIDNGNPLGVSIADGNLPDVPLIKFNKDGSLLAVTAKNNRINILASRDGMQLLETRKVPHRAASEITANTSSKRPVHEICDEISPYPFALIPANDDIMNNNGVETGWQYSGGD